MSSFEVFTIPSQKNPNHSEWTKTRAKKVKGAVFQWATHLLDLIFQQSTLLRLPPEFAHFGVRALWSSPISRLLEFPKSGS